MTTAGFKSGRPHSAQVGNHTNQHDTSDSTDTENYGKRRKFKTKHQLDKTKSSSDNFLVDNVQSVNKSVEGSDNNRLISVLPNDISAEAAPRTTNELSKQNDHSDGVKPHHMSADGVKPHHMSADGVKPHHMSADGVKPNHMSADGVKPHHMSVDKLTALSPSATLGNSLQSQSSKSAVNLNTSHDSTLSNSHLKNPVANQNGQLNYLSPDTPAGRLSREVSVSSHSSSQSDPVREGDGTAVEKKGHVVYHWAMIQLSMTPEVERFMQDIVSTLSVLYSLLYAQAPRL